MIQRKLHSERASSIDAVEARLAGMNARPRLWLSVMACLLVVQVSPWWYSDNDSSRYLSIARSIARDDSIAAFGSPQLIASPGYPLLISPAFLFGNRPLLAISVIHWLIAVVGLIGVYVWARRVIPSAAVTVTGLAMLNTAVWFYYRVALKEMAFLTVLVWAVNSTSALQRAASRKAAIGYGFVATALMTLLCLIRYTGIVVLAGFAISLCMQAWRERERRMRSIVLLVAVSVPIVAGVLSLMAHERQMAATHGGATYEETFLQNLGQAANRVPEMIRTQIEGIGRICVPGLFKASVPAGRWLHVNMLIYLAFFLFAAAGWWQLVRRNGDVFALTLPFYAAMYVMWGFEQGSRFFVCMAPLLMTCAALALFRTRPTRFYTTVTCVTLAHLGVATGYWLSIDAPRARAADAKWPAIETIASTIEQSPGPVEFFEGANTDRRMLELTIDRAIETWEGSQSPRDATQWLVASKANWKDDQPPAHFRQVQVVQDYVVFRR